MFTQFERTLARTFGFLPPQNIALAVSGGVDSMALCSMASEWARPRKVKLHGFIVDHGIRDGSNLEQDTVASAIENLGITPHKLNINMMGVPGTRIELAARNLRIAALKEACTANNITNVLFGHHKDDQYETFIIRLLSHSNWYGLAGIQPVTRLDPSPEPPGSQPVNSVRPLLGFEKKDLVKWCTDHRVPWVEDATNKDPSLTLRNAIRKLRADFGDLLPQQLLPETIWALQSQYARRREKAEAEARALWTLSLKDGLLVLDPIAGTASLEMGNEFDLLGIDAKVALMGYLAQYATPLDVGVVSHRRKALLRFIQSGYAKQVAMDVSMEKIESRILFQRARLRHTTRADQNDQVHVFTATKEWSPWRLIDKRYWMRWKLPQSCNKCSRHISIYMNNGDFIFKVREALAHLGPLAHGECKTQPLFAFTDSGKSVNEISPEDLIGYPVLSRYQNLDIECRYKQVGAI